MRIIIATAATYTLMHISKHGQNIIKGAKLFPVPNDCNFLEEIKALTNSKEFHLQMFWWKSNWSKVKVWQSQRRTRKFHCFYPIHLVIEEGEALILEPKNIAGPLTLRACYVSIPRSGYVRLNGILYPISGGTPYVSHHASHHVRFKRKRFFV